MISSYDFDVVNGERNALGYDTATDHVMPRVLKQLPSKDATFCKAQVHEGKKNMCWAE